MKHIRAAIDILVDELTVNEGKIADVEKSIGLLRIKLENLEKMKKQFEAAEAMENSLDLVRSVLDQYTIINRNCRPVWMFYKSEITKTEVLQNIFQ